MEAKKTPKADLAKKSFLFFNVGLIVSLALTITAFTYRVYDDTSFKDLTKDGRPEEEIMEVPVTQHLPPPPPQIQQPQLIEVPNEQEIEEELDIVMDAEITEDTPLDPIISQPLAEEERENPDEIFRVVEESAAPIDGMKAFYESIQKKMKYPAQARRMSVEGKVFVEFVIEKDGSITDVKSIKGIGAGCDEEAVRVVQSSPKWKPGKQRGKAVRQRMVLPIVFQLGN